MMRPARVFVTALPSLVRSREKRVRKLFSRVVFRFSEVSSELKTGTISISSMKLMIGEMVSL